MNNEKSNPAMHFFLYLLHFLSLFFVALGFGNIVFQLINKFVTHSADFSQQGFFEQMSVKFGIAAIFVAGPLFFFTARLIAEYLFEGSISTDSRIRKWLTYIILFFAASTIIGDLIALIVSFLNGDIAGRFVLKVLTILIIAGSIFGYYFWDIRREKIEGGKFKENKIAFRVSLVAILLVFVSGFLVIDGPKVSREKKVDLQTMNDLQNIDSNMMAYFLETGNLPDDLGQLKNTRFFPFMSREGSVEYKKTGENTYQLCSHFNHPSIESNDRYYSDPYSNQWLHERGRACFDRVAIKEGVKMLPEMAK